jgi:hypothetical protein
MVVVERDFPDLVQRAEAIVAGTVSEVRNAHKESGSPVTLVTVSDLTVLKGDTRSSITLEFYGGITGNVSGFPTCRRFMEARCCSSPAWPEVCPLVGVWQGSWVRFDESLLPTS